VRAHEVARGDLGIARRAANAAQCSAVAPWLAERLIRAAVRVLPAGQRHRYLAEWLAELDAVPGQLVKLLFAVKIFLCAPATRRGLQGADSLWVLLVRRLLVALVTAALAAARLATRMLARMPTKPLPDDPAVLLIDMGEEGNATDALIVDTAAPLDTPIEELGLSVRSYNCLKRVGITTVGELAAMSEADLLDIRNVGRSSVNEFRTQLLELGLTLREDEPL
jgi:hypothetical protein